MPDIILPKIIKAGVYDAATIHKDCIETRNRNVSVFEIELPISKGGTSFINQSQHDISPTHIICGKPGQVRHTHLPFRCRFIHLILKDEFLKNLILSFPDFIDIGDNTKKFKRIFAEIVQAYNFPTSNHELYLGGKTLQLLYMLSNQITEIKNSAFKNNKIVSDGIAYMDKHFTENITLQEVADFIGINPIYFHQVFTNTMGKTTPHDYITNKRIDMAKKLLVTSLDSLADIAYQTGFSSQSYFGQVFKKKVNMTPREYRNANYMKYPEK